MRYCFVVCFVVLISSGCPKSNTPIERNAYNTFVAANASIKSIRAKHPECATQSAGICALLAQATSAKDSLIDAAEVYCAGPDFNALGPCNPPAKGTPAAAQATAKLQAAIASYNQIAKNLKEIQ